MSTQHTPGPWIGAGPSFGDPYPRYTTSIVTEREDDDEGIVEICELPFHHRDDENEANARIIAAAPDLLEAIKGLLESVTDAINAGDWKVDGACDPDIDIQRANAAIAKATGEK